jgi:hypothetical protein
VVPATVLASLAGPDARVVDVRAEPVGDSLGSATASVTRLTATLQTGAGRQTVRLVRKQLRPAPPGRWYAGSTRPEHWTYWRREALAYRSGLLPTGPGLAAPRCHGVVDDAVYLDDVQGPPEDPVTAAVRLGRWQAVSAIPDVAWLAGHQLAQRVGERDLDWSAVDSAVDADSRLRRIWNRRTELLASLDEVPRVLTHGDYHRGNLVATDPATTVAYDWAGLGAAPVGADLAHLALSALGRGDDLLDGYLDGLGGRFEPALVGRGYRVTVALVGAGRTHWMHRYGVRIPAGYVDFVAGVV